MIIMSVVLSTAISSLYSAEHLRQSRISFDRSILLAFRLQRRREDALAN